MKGNSSSEHLIVVKTWMKTNEVGETVCIFETFDMEKFFGKEGLIDSLHSMDTKSKLALSDYRIWFHLNNKNKNINTNPIRGNRQGHNYEWNRTVGRVIYSKILNFKSR